MWLTGSLVSAGSTSSHILLVICSMTASLKRAVIVLSFPGTESPAGKWAPGGAHGPSLEVCAAASGSSNTKSSTALQSNWLERDPEARPLGNRQRRLGPRSSLGACRVHRLRDPFHQFLEL